ncbi:MAG: xanthine dehydrogenase small subunit [Burkholderiales bacterium]|nr:xanthine dehydrogenase small subunit [Burkholderiales bacterium]
MSDAIRFVLNGRRTEVTGLDPHTPLLTWLREHAGLTGTKEGCAEGDCGACTVVVGSADGAGGVRLAPLNACICLLPSIDGRAVFTVEGLGGDARPHPVQQALVDCHGSQCGFCTPGFVMSLLALYKSDPAPTRDAATAALAGNLCRCTGYRPILDAAVRMAETGAARMVEPDPGPAPLADWLATPAGAANGRHPGEAALADMLAALARDDDFSYAAAGATFHAPRSADAFGRLVEAHPQAWILAGGTDVGLWINKGLQRAPTIIHTGRVAGLDAIGTVDGGLSIGAAVPLEAAFQALNRHYPELAPLWLRFASPPIRAAGTLGGNVANGSPIGDSMPVLIALGARVVLRRGTATRELALEDLYLDYRRQARAAGEWVERVVVPARRAGAHVAGYKNAKRDEQDISAVCLGAAFVRDGERARDVRIAYGGLAGIPRRARAAEAALEGAVWEEAALRRAMAALADDFTPLSDMRASAAYRMKVARNLLLRLFHETTGAGGETRVIG